MIVEAPSDTAGAEARGRQAVVKPGFLPPFKSLSLAALASNAPVIGGLLVFNKVHLGLGVFAGYALAVVVYGFLYMFVTRGMDPLIDGMRGQANPPVKGALGVFMMQLALKFIALGALVYCLLHLLAVNVVGLAIGACVTQLAVTVYVVKYISHKSQRIIS